MFGWVIVSRQLHFHIYYLFVAWDLIYIYKHDGFLDVALNAGNLTVILTYVPRTPVTALIKASSHQTQYRSSAV
jgi:hypothetical protein